MSPENQKTSEATPISPATPAQSSTELHPLHWSVASFTIVTIIAAAVVGIQGTDFFTQLTMACGIILCLLAWRYVRDSLVVLVLATLVAGAVLGWGLNFYDKIVWYDDAAHFVFSLIGIMGLARLVLHKFQADSNWLLVTALWLSWLGVGSIWELGEWISDQLTNTRHSRGYFDTMFDMILNSTGALIGALFYWRWFRLERAELKK